MVLQKVPNQSGGLPKGYEYYDWQVEDENYSYIDSLDYWPCVSYSKPSGATKNSSGYYPVVKTSSNFLTNNVPTYSGNSNYDSNWNSKTKKYDYTENGFTNYYNAFAYNNAGYDGYFLYDVKVKIVDKDGKDLVAGQRYLPKKSYNSSDIQYVNFKGLSQKIYEKIDDGEAYPVLEGLYLQYGYQPLTDYMSYRDDRSSPSFKKNLPEKSVDVSKVQVLYHGKKDLYEKALRIKKTDSLFKKFYEDKITTETDDYVEYKITMFESTWWDYKPDVTHKIGSNDDSLAHRTSYENSFDFPIYELANRLSEYDDVSTYYDGDGKKVDGDGYRFVIKKIKSYWGDTTYTWYFYRKKEFSDAEKTARKDAALKSAQAYIDLEDDIKTSCEKFGVDFCSNASKVENLIGELKTLKEKDGKPSEFNSVLNSLDGYISTENYSEFKKEFEELYEKSKDAQSIYDSQKKRYDDVYSVLKNDSDYNSYGKVFYYSDNSYATSLKNLKSAIDSNKIKNKAKYRDEVAALDFTEMETKVAQHKETIAAAQKTYDSQKARYDAVYAVLKDESNYKSTLGRNKYNYSTGTYYNNYDTSFENLKSAIDTLNFGNIKKYEGEVSAFDFTEMEKKVEEYKTKSANAQSVYETNKAKYETVYPILKNDSSYKSVLDKNIYDDSTRKYCDKIEFALACLKSSIDSNNLVNVVKYMSEVESYDLTKMEAKSNEYKTKSANAQSVYESNKAKYDAVYPVLKNDSSYKSVLDKNVYDSSTRKYCDKIEFALACLKSSIDSNNLVNVVKYMSEVESYDLTKMEAKTNEYKTKSADAQSVYESNKAKYDAVYPVLKFDSEYNEWGKFFYSSNNKYSEGLAKLKSALEKDNIPNLAKCRDEVAAFDFTEMEKKVEDYKTKSSDAQKIYDTQKAKYDAVYSVLKLDSDYTGSGKIFYSSSSKYSEGLARLKSALGKDNIPNLAKCRDEVAAFDFTELETKVAEYKTIADSAQSVYENYKSRYDAIYSILKDDINYKSLLDKNNYDYSAGVYYNKIELALNGFKTAIDSKNIVKIAKQKKEVDAIDFDGMETKTVEYKTKSSDAQSVYNSQKLKYDMIYEILKNDKKYTSQGGVFSSPDNVYSKTLSNLKTALDNKNFVEIAKYRDEVTALDFSELSGEFDAYIEKLENALSVYESQKAIYDLVYDVLKDDKAYGGKKKIFSSSYNTYSRKLELLKKSIDEKNFYEIEKWQSDVARFDFTELIEAAQNYIDKADGAQELYDSLYAEYDETRIALVDYKKYQGKLKNIEKSLSSFKKALDSKSIVNIGKEKELSKKIDFSSFKKEMGAYRADAMIARAQLDEIEKKVLELEVALKDFDLSEKFAVCKADVAMYKQNFDVWNVRKTAECKDVLNILHYNELCKIYNVVESRRLLKEKFAEFGYIGNYENAETESNATFVVTEIVPDSNADGQSIKPNNILVFDDVESAYKSFSAMKKKGNKVTVLAYTKEKQKKPSKVTIKMKK